MADRSLVEAKRHVRVRASLHRKLSILKFETDVDTEEWAEALMEFSLRPENLKDIRQQLIDKNKSSNLTPRY